MSNVRDYLKEKEKRLGGIQGINYKDKIWSHRLAVFYRTALVLILIAAGVVFLVFQWKNKIFTDSVIVNSSPVTVVQGARVEKLGGNILLYSKDGMSCLDSKGGALWNQTFEMQNPMVSVCGHVAAVGDYNGRTIYVVNSGGQMGTVNTNLPIRKICVSESGVVAAVLDDADVTRILLYDGNEDTETSIVELKAISYLYVDSGDMKTTVAFFNFGEVGRNQSDNYVSGYDYLDTIVPFVQFMNNNTAFGISDDRIVFFEGSEKPANIATAFLEEEVQGVYYNESYVGVVFVNQTGESAYRMDVYGASGNKVHSLFFDIEYSDIILNRDQIILYNDLECQICNIGGVDKFTGEFEKPVTLLVPTSSVYRYVAVTGSSIDTIELK